MIESLSLSLSLSHTHTHTHTHTCTDTVDMNSFTTMQYLQSPISLHVAILDNYKEWTSFCTMTWTPFTQLLPQVRVNYFDLMFCCL